MVDADGDELCEIARAEPDGEAPLVDRPRADIADAHHEDFHAVLVGIEAAERLAENLGHAIAAVGLDVDAMVDGLAALVEANRVVARREEDALHAILPRRLEDVVATNDVRLEDRVPRTFDRIATEVD